MSQVSGVTLICDLIESESDDGAELLEKLNSILKKYKGNDEFAELSQHYGGHKHPQCLAFGAGVNFLDEDEFAQDVMALDWQCPENVVLVIRPEEGATRVWRPEHMDY